MITLEGNIDGTRTPDFIAPELRKAIATSEDVDYLGGFTNKSPEIATLAPGQRECYLELADKRRMGLLLKKVRGY